MEDVGEKGERGQAPWIMGAEDDAAAGWRVASVVRQRSGCAHEPQRRQGLVESSYGPCKVRVRGVVAVDLGEGRVTRLDAVECQCLTLLVRSLITDEGEQAARFLLELFAM